MDVNGDERMEWEELTSYIVESHASPTVQLPAFHAVPPLPDQSRLRSGQTIERIFFVPVLDLLLLCERPQPIVSVYSPKHAACLHQLRGHRAEARRAPPRPPETSRTLGACATARARWTCGQKGSRAAGRSLRAVLADGIASAALARHLAEAFESKAIAAW